MDKNNEDLIKAMQGWAQSARGQFAFQQKRRLLQAMISVWPRRKQKLLVIGCGSAFFMPMFWEAGFDVSGAASSPELLGQVRDKIGHKVDLHLASPEHLPFDDNEFDFATLLTVLETSDSPQNIIKEAGRVSRKGLLLSFLNQFSFFYLAQKGLRREKNDNVLGQIKWYNWLQVRNLLTSCLGPCYMQAGSILLGPTWSWSPWPGLRHLNNIITSPWWGALTVVRVDLTNHPVQTPLLAWKPEAALLQSNVTGDPVFYQAGKSH